MQFLHMRPGPVCRARRCSFTRPNWKQLTLRKSHLLFFSKVYSID